MSIKHIQVIKHFDDSTFSRIKLSNKDWRRKCLTQFLRFCFCHHTSCGSFLPLGSPASCTRCHFYPRYSVTPSSNSFRFLMEKGLNILQVAICLQVHIRVTSDSVTWTKMSHIFIPWKGLCCNRNVKDVFGSQRSSQVILTSPSHVSGRWGSVKSGLFL